MMLKERLKRERWGEQGPIPNALFGGHRVVAVFNKLLSFQPNATYHDFLTEYIRLAVGEEWWKEEASKPSGAEHQLISWERKVFNFLARHSSGGSGIQSAPLKGVVGHFLRLAFDLHTIHHQGLLQEQLVKRLKVPKQFQGARYEVAVSAAFVRAGFKIEFEPEGKGPEKLCEFVATHGATGSAYSVEAKSRHIAGVLGHSAEANSTSKEEPNVRRLILKGLSKVARHPRVICVDVNFPHAEGAQPQTTWGPVVRKQINSLEADGHGPAIAIFTNSPHHYLGDEDVAHGDATMIMGLSEERFRPQDMASVEENFPGLIRTANSFTTAVPADWD